MYMYTHPTIVLLLFDVHCAMYMYMYIYWVTSLITSRPVSVYQLHVRELWITDYSSTNCNGWTDKLQEQFHSISLLESDVQDC